MVEDDGLVSNEEFQSPTPGPLDTRTFIPFCELCFHQGPLFSPLPPVALIVSDDVLSLPPAASSGAPLARSLDELLRAAFLLIIAAVSNLQRAHSFCPSSFLTFPASLVAAPYKQGHHRRWNKLWWRKSFSSHSKSFLPHPIPTSSQKTFLFQEAQ